MNCTIERLTLPVSDRDVADLSRLLIETVHDGAAVSFVIPLSEQQAEAWWRKTLASIESGAIILVAREAGGAIVGSVQCHPAWAPNQPHRADIAKLIVARRCRRDGLGTRLMQAAEAAAREAGYTLLTLDARRGAAAEQLYRKNGWTCVGIIPHFAVDPDGKAFHDTVIFYKDLAAEPNAVR